MRTDRLRRVLAGVLCALLLVACAAETGEETPTGYEIWFAAAPGGRGGPAIIAERRAGAENMPAVRWMMDALLAGPEGINLYAPFPDGVTLRDWWWEGDVLCIDLSEQYTALSGIALTIADYCITLTLAQIEGVDGISITAEGRTLPGRGRQVLRPDDVVLSGAGETPVYVSAMLYFPRTAGKGLGVEPRTVLVREGDTLATAVANALLSGPEADSLRTLIPGETQLLSVAVSDRVCYIDVSAALLEGLPESDEEGHLLLYSIVDTMGNLENVDAVLLLVEGETIPYLGGVPADKPLEPDFRLTEN